MKIICLPYSGASSSIFLKWHSFLPRSWSLIGFDYPGHGKRINEPLMYSCDSLVNNLCEYYKDEFNGPFILFGHSLGAIVAYELAKKLLGQGKNLKALFVSGRKSIASPKALPDITNLDDLSFLKELNKRYSGIPLELFTNDDLRQLFVPILKADIYIAELYQPKNIQFISCYMHVFIAQHDQLVTYDEAKEWLKLSTSPGGITVLPGNHISCMTEEASIRSIVETIKACII